MSALEQNCARLLRASAAQGGLAVTARATGSRDWASALFTGVRLTFELAVDDDCDAFEHWLATLPDAEFPLRGHFVASADVVARAYGVATVELLVIEEA